METYFENMSRIHLKMLKNDFNQGAIIPFIGAGLSADLDKNLNLYPTWEHFLIECAKNTLNYKEIEELIKSNNLLAAADEINKGYRPFSEVIKYTYGTKIKNYPSKCPVSLLPKLFPNSLVITTNFDYVLDDIYQRNGNAFVDIDCSYSNYIIGDAIRENKHYLLKLHGKANDLNSLVLTQSQYNEMYGSNDIDFNKPLPKALYKLLENKKILFLGCSFREEDRFTRIIQKCNETNNGITHYSIIGCSKITSESKALAERLIQKYGIMPIWYPHQQYEWVYEYLNELYTEDIISEGILQLKANLFDCALKTFENEIATVPDNSDIYYYAAISLFQGKNPFFAKNSTVKKAMSYLECAIRIKPQANYYYACYLICKYFYEEHGLRGKYNSKSLYEKAVANGITEEKKIEINQYFNN